ncbi:MAG: putative Na+/H+ antiporter [Steroidobacteraceae bacterium]
MTDLNPTTIQIIAAALFAVAIIHTFSTKYFEHLAHTRPAHSGLWHLLGEVEIVFGFWALVLAVTMVLVDGTDTMKQYVNSRNFTEPLFVFVIMVVAATRPILQTSKQLVEVLAKLIPGKGGISTYFIVLTIVPLLGSFITEPAAMTLAALILAEKFFSKDISSKLKYATIGVLFVNISIGGTLTAYAAPPVLMVAGTWNWDTAFMLTHFGWKAAIAVFINGTFITLFFAKELAQVSTNKKSDSESPTVPLALVLIHIAILAGIVLFAHYPPLFIGLFLLFMGIATAYSAHQDRLILREGLLVAFFLGGLVVLGGQQQWWLQPLLVNMSSDAVFYGATALTAITDNAALTYLGSLVDGLSDEFKYSLVAGAVTGGGLTIIANAPNPAGVAILRRYFDEGAVSPTGLFLSALLPTLVALLAFRYL